MSIEQRRTATVLDIIQNLVAAGQAQVRPGHVNSQLREMNQPMGTWEVRAEFSRLVREGYLTPNPATGDFQLTEKSAQESAG